ncbi:hypothetical protein EDB89DRAFT_1908876 [Lactarius sanguifluus]|nr:hypothetical protein EDB89DRAFT_1908876 [Lactarius sanguifluus]
MYSLSKSALPSLPLSPAVPSLSLLLAVVSCALCWVIVGVMPCCGRITVGPCAMGRGGGGVTGWGRIVAAGDGLEVTLLTHSTRWVVVGGVSGNASGLANRVRGVVVGWGLAFTLWGTSRLRETGHVARWRGSCSGNVVVGIVGDEVHEVAPLEKNGADWWQIGGRETETENWRDFVHLIIHNAHCNTQSHVTLSKKGKSASSQVIVRWWSVNW